MIAPVIRNKTGNVKAVDDAFLSEPLFACPAIPEVDTPFLIDCLSLSFSFTSLLNNTIMRTAIVKEMTKYISDLDIKLINAKNKKVIKIR